MEKAVHNSVLVTGAGGFLGTHTADLLEEKGWRVLRGTRQECTDGSSIVVDVSSPIEAAALPFAVSAVVHLAAAVPAVFTGQEAGSARLFPVNLGGTYHALELARAVGAKVFVYASSMSVYGRPESLPVREDAPCAFAGPAAYYSLSKFAGESLCGEYGRKREMHCAMLRFSSIYGPGMKSGGVLTRFLEKCRAGEPIEIFCDGSGSSDFLFVRDAAEAIALALADRAAGVYNIGSGEETTLLELANTAREVSGASNEVRILRRGAPSRFVMDISRAKEEIGFEPRTALREGLQRLVSSM